VKGTPDGFFFKALSMLISVRLFSLLILGSKHLVAKVLKTSGFFIDINSDIVFYLKESSTFSKSG